MPILLQMVFLVAISVTNESKCFVVWWEAHAGINPQKAILNQKALNSAIYGSTLKNNIPVSFRSSNVNLWMI